MARVTHNRSRNFNFMLSLTVTNFIRHQSFPAASPHPAF